MTQAADGGVHHHLGHFVDEGPAGRRQRAPLLHLHQRLVLADCADPARHALPARLVAEELGDADHHVSHVHRRVEGHHHTRAEGGARGPGVLQGQRKAQRVRAHERPGRPAHQHRLQFAGAGDAPGQRQHISERRAERHLVEAGSPQVPRQAQQLGARRTLGSPAAVRVGTLDDDVEDVQQGLGVVDGGRLAEEAVGGGERGLVAGLAAESLQRVEQGGLLAADVGARPPPDGDVEVVAGAGRVRAEQARGSQPLDGALQAGGGQRVLAPDVDPAVVRPGGQPRDGHGLDHRERVLLHHNAVLERARLGLVAVGHHMLGPPGFGGHGAPLDPGREGGSASSRQPRGGHRLQDCLRSHLPGPSQRLVAAVGDVGLQRLGVGCADAAQQTQRRIPGLGQREGLGVGGHIVGAATGPLHEQRRSPLALAQARPQVHLATVGPDR